MNEITLILSKLGNGDPSSADELLVAVYDELRKLAHVKLSNEPAGQTLQATALVHEAYLRLLPKGATDKEKQHWNGRGHFFGAAAEAMRRILVENARRKQAGKRGGDLNRVGLTGQINNRESSPEKLLQLNDAIDALEHSDARNAELAKLKIFTGLSTDDAALVLGISRATAHRKWSYCRAVLIDQLD